MNSLLDLFLLICRDLQTDYTRKRNSYRLLSGSLTVALDVTIDKFDILEVLEVNKAWDSAVRERFVYSMAYVEPHIYEAHEREKIKTDPEEDWSYRHHQQLEKRNRYLSKEMYADNLTIIGPYMCRWEYEATRVSHGLQSLAHLKIPPSTDKDGEALEIFPKLYADMVKTGDWLLARQLGPDRARWKGALRRGKADIPLPFKTSLKDVLPVWIVGRGIVGLCRVYAQPVVH